MSDYFTSPSQPHVEAGIQGELRKYLLKECKDSPIHIIRVPALCPGHAEWCWGHSCE